MFCGGFPFPQRKRIDTVNLRRTRVVSLSFMTLASLLRAQMNFDVYNALNASSLLAINNTYGGQWRIPISNIPVGNGVLNARLFQVSGRLSF